MFYDTSLEFTIDVNDADEGERGLTICFSTDNN